MFRNKNRLEKIIFHENHFYWIKSTRHLTSGLTQYVCCKFHKHKYWKCKASGKLVDGQVILSARNNQHTCDQSDELSRVYTFREALHRAVQTNSRRTAYTVYQDISRQHPDAAILCPFETIRPSLQRWLSSARPSIPKRLSFRNYFETLTSDQWRPKYTQRGPVNLTVRHVEGPDNLSVIIYTDVEFTQSLPPLTSWCIDGTFKVCPKKPKMCQFLTIMAQVDDVWLPFAWAITTHKSIPAYQALFRELQNIYGDRLQPNKIMMDFEAALKAAAVEFFPNAVIQHCHFHHSQAVIKNLSAEKGKNRLYQTLKAWPRGLLFLRKLLALILLPAALIENAFYRLVETADNDITIYFHNLLLYYQRQWLRRIGPNVYSLYNERNRTNNPLESYHNLLGQFLIGYRRNIWFFTESILDLILKTRNEFLSLERGLTVRRRQRSTITRQLDMVDRAWDIFIRNPRLIQIDQFLSAASHIYPSFGGHLVCTNVQQIDEFLNVHTYDDITRMFPDIHQYDVIDEAGNHNILHRTGCLLCGCRFLANCITLPCYHWYGCEGCVEHRLRIARTLNINLRCSTCNIIWHTAVNIDILMQITK